MPSERANSPYYVILITTPNETVAATLARELVENHLAACVSRVPSITSVYFWEGKIHEDTECLLICKTDHKTWPSLLNWVKVHHPYDEPEIIALPIAEGSTTYLDWVSSCL